MPYLHHESRAKASLLGQVCVLLPVLKYFRSPSLRAEMGSHLKDILKCLWVCMIFSSNVQTSGQKIKIKAHDYESTLLSPLSPIESRCFGYDVHCELLNKAADMDFHTQEFTHSVSVGHAPLISPSLHVQNPAVRGAVKIHSLPTRACNEQVAPTACSSFMCYRWTSYLESDFIFIKYFPI